MRLLKDPALANAAVIINEFGEIGLDHLLVETADDNVFEMSSGCLCCTIRGDLVDTLQDLATRRASGEIKAFDRVIIETTGLADPAPVLQTLMSHPGLLQRYRLENVVTVVDSVNGFLHARCARGGRASGGGCRPGGADQDRPSDRRRG
jgi:G3E family GTPase